MKSNFPSLAGMVLLFALLACNMPFEQFPPPNEVQTAAALTLQAILTPSITAAALTPEVVTATASPRVTRTVTSVGSPTTSITPTYSVPMLTVRESTNCRTGPGETYEVIFTYLEGKELEIVGRYDPGNFWLVKSNESSNGTCWLWGEFAEVTGSYWAVPSVTPPPTATGAPPRAAGLISYEFFCPSLDVIDITILWEDNASDETGYRILGNGQVIAELPANATTHTQSIQITSGQSAEFYIQVHSPNGSANTRVGTVSCP